MLTYNINNFKGFDIILVLAYSYIQGYCKKNYNRLAHFKVLGDFNIAQD